LRYNTLLSKSSIHVMHSHQLTIGTGIGSLRSPRNNRRLVGDLFGSLHIPLGASLAMWRLGAILSICCYDLGSWLDQQRG
jgi:hypothetical protein